MVSGRQRREKAAGSHEMHEALRGAQSGRGRRAERYGEGVNRRSIAHCKLPAKETEGKRVGEPWDGMAGGMVVRPWWCARLWTAKKGPWTVEMMTCDE